jgi:hypothetical protein
MQNEVYWLKPGRVLYVRYTGDQTAETLQACMDAQAAELDKLSVPAIVLVNWLEVTGVEPGALKSTRGHRGYSHPMAARGVLVGMDRSTAFQNEISAFTTRQSQHTKYLHPWKSGLSQRHAQGPGLSSDFVPESIRLVSLGAPGGRPA